MYLDTEAEEYKRISPKKGRAIYFDGDIYHSKTALLIITKEYYKL